MENVSKLKQGVGAVVTGYVVLILLGSLVIVGVNANILVIELIKTLTELALWLAIPFLVLAVLVTAWRAAIFALIAVVLFAVFYLPYLPRNPQVPAGEQLRLMTFNTQMTDNNLLDIFDKADAEVVALQELSQDGAAVLENNLQEEYPYQALHAQETGKLGIGVLSRYPITNDEYWEYADLPHTTGHQRVEIDFAGESIVIYNTHPWPPIQYSLAITDTSHRVALMRVMERAFAETNPVVFVGDLNMTDEFAEYDMLAARFTDSYLQAGDGLGYTFPNNKTKVLPSLLRLDYIFHTHEFQSIDSDVLEPANATDHSPVVSTLVWINSN